MEIQKHENKAIVFFDGDCVFCSGSVQWVMQNEKSEELYFAALQTDFAKEFLPAQNLDLESLPDSILLWYENQLFVKSEAALKIAEYLKFPLSLIRVFSILPTAFNNFFYDFIARNRYDWFGKRESCFRPLPEEKDRFLSE
ncbi:MAG: DCC1-like thiol-disulfide oxidoreductase family protein [Chitinophagales bacterium]